MSITVRCENCGESYPHLLKELADLKIRKNRLKKDAYECDKYTNGKKCKGLLIVEGLNPDEHKQARSIIQKLKKKRFIIIDKSLPTMTAGLIEIWISSQSDYFEQRIEINETTYLCVFKLPKSLRVKSNELN